jgi:hypothetical protein
METDHETTVELVIIFESVFFKEEETNEIYGLNRPDLDMEIWFNSDSV